MNKLTSAQRKLVYLVLVMVLFIPVIYLGAPAAPAGGSQAAADAGGVLSQMRAKYDLGEAAIGKIDPASASMNLVLLGFRGLATCVLYTQAQEQQKTKNWAELEATTEAIILLQPHFIKVWSFQGWNLAYNVSVAWDAVEDRYYWIKRGVKFLKRGVERNQKNPELYWHTGTTLAHKIGRADEAKLFRKYFRYEDPELDADDPTKKKYPGGFDTEINPRDEDNYLAARTPWYEDANRVRLIREQHIMAAILFVAYPQRALFDYASAMQRDGIFDEVCQKAWEDSFEQWTRIYGREEFPSEGGPVHLEVSPEEEKQMQEEDAQRLKEEQEKKNGQKPKDENQEDEPPSPRLTRMFWVQRFQDMTHYRYWRLRGEVERLSNTVLAHRLLYEGEQAFLRGDLSASRKLLEEGMAKFEVMLKEFESIAADDRDFLEEGALAQLYWRAIHRLDDQPLPDDYPLKKFWESPDVQGRMSQIQEEFQRRVRNYRRGT